MATEAELTTREWLNPPGPLRRFRLAVAALLAVSVVLTAGLTATMLAGLAGFGLGMGVVAALGVVYLLLWAADLVAVYTDPDHDLWTE